jgi:PTH1 family peptidyl-tRNA hydrolase
MVADLLAGRLGGTFKVHKRSGAEIVTGRLGNRPVILAKPRTYMNESGRHVGPLAKFYSVSPADVIVIHDELDIDFGRIRLKLGGGEGGHNGLRSGARPAARTQPRSCSRASVQPNEPRFRRCASRPPMPPSF